MKHIAIIYGTRPQVIKLAPLVKELDKHKDQLTYTLINTGQHYDENMDGVFHKQLGIGEPDVNIGLSRASNQGAVRIGELIIRIESLVVDFHISTPNLVIVIGDTDSTLAGALAANKMGIPIAHIEAGIRSGNKSQPEEINRILT